MSLYLMWVYSITRSQLCWDWVLDYVSMRLLSLTQFIWRPSVLQLCCSGTHRINTRSNVTVPDVSVFHHKKSIVLRLGAWLCKHETALPHTIHLETIRPQLCCSGTHRINTRSNVTVLMSVYSITRSQLCFNWVLDYVSMRLLSLIQFIWETIRPPSCAALALTESTTQLNTIDSLWWNTLTSGTVTLLRVLILWVPERTTGDGWVSKWIVWGRAVSCLHNQAPNWNTIDSCDGIHWHQVQWHYYVYWFCECQSSTTGGRMVSKWIVWGRAVSCLHNQAPNLNTIDFLWWNTLTSGTVTLLRVLILWVPEQHNWRTDGLQMNCVRESKSHAYIIKHPSQHNWLLVMEYTHIRYSDITMCIDSVSARAAQLGTDGLQMNCVREAVSCLHNQAPNLNTIDSLRWNTLTSGTVTLLLVLISVSARAGELGDGWSPNECVGRAVSCLHNQAPNWNTIDFCDGIHSHQVQWHYYVVLILWVPEQHNWGTVVSKMNCVRERQSHAYIIKHQLKHQLTPCDGIHWHQVQWHYYVYWFCECQSSTTGGRMVSKWIVWGRAVSCLHNQAPNLNTIDSLRWNTLTSGTVTLLRVLILWVPEQHNWRTDGLQMNCMRESSLMLT